MKAKSLSVFRTKLRHDDPGTVLVSVGQIIDGDDDHMRALARNRLVELVDEDDVKPAKAAKAKAETKAKSETKPGPAAKAAKAKDEEPQPETGAAEPPAAEQAAPEKGEGAE